MNTARRILAATITATALAAGGVLVTEATADAPHNYPACEYEDSPGPCYWDAEERGNGGGQSFVRH